MISVSATAVLALLAVGFVLVSIILERAEKEKDARGFVESLRQQALDRSRSMQLITHAQNKLSEDPSPAFLLAIEAARLAPSHEASQLLRGLSVHGSVLMAGASSRRLTMGQPRSGISVDLQLR